MKDLSDKNKRRLAIAGLGIVCIALVIAISMQFNTAKSVDHSVVSSPKTTRSALEKNVVIQTNEPTAASIKTTNEVVSSGTDQAIQPDPVKTSDKKPTSQNEIANPDKTTHKPQNTSVSNQTEPKAGEKKEGKVYLPGFGWVTETGGSGTKVDGSGDINKQVGQMD